MKPTALDRPRLTAADVPPVPLTDVDAWKLRALVADARRADADARQAADAATRANDAAKAHWQDLAVRYGFDPAVARQLMDDGRLLPAPERPTP